MSGIGWFFWFHSAVLFFFLIIGPRLLLVCKRTLWGWTHGLGGFCQINIWWVLMEIFAYAPQPCPSPHATEGCGWSCAAVVHFGFPSGGFGCFLLTSHATAAFDLIMPVAGLAVKQTTGMKAEAPRSHPLLRSCSPCQAPHTWTCHRQGQQITFHPWQGNGFTLHASTHTSGRMCQYLCPVGTRPVEKIRIFPLEQIWRNPPHQLEMRRWGRADMHLCDDLILYMARSITVGQRVAS